MIKIGVTGGIGSGKSMVCRIFSALSVPVFYADIVAKEIAENDKDVVRLIKENFGNDIFTQEGKLDRKRLSEIVFNDSKKLNTLNNIIHPAVKNAFDFFLNENKNAPYTVKEAAILVESGAYKHVDKIIVVTAPVKQRIQRVVKRDDVSENEVQVRINKQLPQEDLIKYAHFIINNEDGAMLLPQVIEINKSILKEIK